MADLSQLPDLGWFEPRRWLPTDLVAGITTGKSSALGIQFEYEAGTMVARRTPAVGPRTKADQLLKRFEEPKDCDFMNRLNRRLAGEIGYPVLAKALGGAIGKLGIDYATALFKAAQALAGATEKSGHVFFRDRDEIWRVEAIGRAGTDGSKQPVYVTTLLLVDPFRSSPTRGAWILHEQRYKLVG